MENHLLSHYRHICFDLDGTLVHTIASYRQRILREVVEALGGPRLSAEEADRFWFDTERTALVEQVIGLDPERFWQVWNERAHPEERARYTFAYTDAAPALHRLKAAGKLTSVITGSSASISALEIAKLNGAPLDYFFSINYERFKEKPDPGSFQFVMQKLGVTAAETIHVGNSDEDAAFAANAGVAFIYLERRVHRFTRRHQAVAVIHSLNELLPD